MGEILLDIPPRAPRAAAPKWAPLALGFRPFFLLAGVSALVLMAVWLAALRGGFAVASHYPGASWHSHEMLFGYGVAVIAGFLLTAVRNWTGIATPSGSRLGGLVVVWLAGRLLAIVPVLPGGVVAVVDLAFLPLLTLALARPLWLGRNRINRIFIPLLLAMAGANLLVHLELLGVTAATAGRGVRLQIDLILLLLLVVTGRVVPFFTAKAIAGSRPRLAPWVERSGILLLMLLMAAELFALPKTLVALLSLALAGVQAWRLWGWQHPGLWRLPILWVLYAGCGWLILGFVLRALGALGVFPANLAVHAFTTGAIGVLTLGMMARVALGHTGRDLVAEPPTVAGFLLLNAAAAGRVFAPGLLPGGYAVWVDVAGLLWIVAFGLFVFVYAPVLLKSRVDGRPG